MAVHVLRGTSGKCWLSGLALAMSLAGAPATAQTVDLPPVNGGYDSQLGGAYPPAPGVMMVSRDRNDPPAAGLYSICYVNAFQAQAEEAGWWKANHADLLLRKPEGAYFEDADWPGEVFFDTSTPAKRQALMAVLGEWVRQCADAGFDAVEPDNQDSWTRSDGLLTMADNLSLARLISDLAHEAGLAVAQKNGPDIGSVGATVAGFDFVIAEDCEFYDECDAYVDVHGDRVIAIEYADMRPPAFDRACAKRGDRLSIVLRDRNLVKPSEPGYRFATC